MWISLKHVHQMFDICSWVPCFFLGIPIKFPIVSQGVPGFSHGFSQVSSFSKISLVLPIIFFCFPSVSPVNSQRPHCGELRPSRTRPLCPGGAEGGHSEAGNLRFLFSVWYVYITVYIYIYVFIYITCLHLWLFRCSAYLASTSASQATCSSPPTSALHRTRAGSPGSWDPRRSASASSPGVTRFCPGEQWWSSIVWLVGLGWFMSV